MISEFNIYDDNEGDKDMAFYDNNYFEIPDECLDPEDAYDDRQLAAFLIGIKPQLSVVEIDRLLSGVSEWVSRINPMILQRVERDVWDMVEGYPVVFDLTRKSIFEVAENPQHTASVQLAVFMRAASAFSKFEAIKCCDHHTLEQFIFNYADASWWSEIWRDLVNKYGDKTPHFLI